MIDIPHRILDEDSFLSLCFYLSCWLFLSQRFWMKITDILFLRMMRNLMAIVTTNSLIMKKKELWQKKKLKSLKGS